MLDGLQGGRADGNDALFFALAEDANGFREGIDMGYVEGDKLREAEAAGVEELEDGGVAGGCPRGGLFLEWSAKGGGEEVFHLGDGKDHGEFALELGELDFLEGIAGEAVALGKPLVKGAKGGEVEANGGARGAAFHELE